MLILPLRCVAFCSAANARENSSFPHRDQWRFEGLAHLWTDFYPQRNHFLHAILLRLAAQVNNFGLIFYIG